MSQADLSPPTTNKPRHATRVRKPSQALLDRAVQGAANEAELNQKLGKKANKATKENRPTTADERRLESRAQITFESVPARKNAGAIKPRAPSGLGTVLQQSALARAAQAATAIAAPATPPGAVTGAAAAAPASTPGAAATLPGSALIAAPGTAQKRPGSPSLELPPARRKRGTGQRKPRPRGGDLPANEKRFVESAYRAVRSLEAINPFTGKDANDVKINNAIAYARRVEPAYKDLSVTEAMRQLIGQRFHQLHGDVKSVAQNLFAAHYGLVSSSNLGTISKNKSIARRLLTGDGFVYKNSKTRLGMYQHPSISDCLNGILFSSRDKEGPSFAKIFNGNNEGIMLETIALVLTALYNCAKEWETGRRQGIQFRETTFRKDYVDLLTRLRAYAKANPVLVGKLRRKLYRAGLAHAGVTVDTTTRSGLTDADIARAVAMDTISDDSEDGGEADDDDEDEEMDDQLAAHVAQTEDAANLDIPADTPAAATPADENQDDTGPRRAKGKAKASIPEDDEGSPSAEDQDEVLDDQELEQQLYAHMTAGDQKLYLKLSYEERDIYLELPPEDRKVFLSMLPEERAEWMADPDADDVDAAPVASGSGVRGAIAFDPAGEDEMSTSSEFEE